MLRRIVPALGVIALASPAAMSQEIAKGLYLDGWIDTILSASDTQYETTGATSNSGANFAAAFTTAAKVKIGWNVTDQVSGKIGVKFNNNVTSTTARTQADGVTPATDDNGNAIYDTTSSSDAYLQEAFFSANFGQGFNVTGGKMISFVGLQSAEPTGLFRVGYTPSISLYTPDMLGVTVGYSNDQFAAMVIVNNGNFDDTGYNDGPAQQTQNNVSHNLGYGIDLTYNLPEKMGNVNLEFAWDPAAGTSTNTTDGTTRPSDVYQIGLNATLKPTDKTTLLAEAIYRAETGAATKLKDKVAGTTKSATKEDFAWMVLANQVVSTEGIPASVSGSFGQYAPGFNNDKSNDSTNTASEVAAALLTNPFGSSSFGANLEVAYAWYDGVKGQNPTGEEGGTTISLEGLVVIP